ncbi:secreted protein [Trypanosoma grayi]|uniref:secreted protein n=1 Tax=Trypanosoma grayi TaxID=71804 RepID=UPI0004F411FC|nr:secreted protein [Trypanosoma grayi]KEG06116.1 secreted protein [Trypanosoma grayi]
MGFRTRRTGAAAGSSGEAIPLNLSFGNFEFEDMKRLGKRGGGVRELASLLRHAQRQRTAHSALLSTEEGIEQRNAELLGTAMQRAAGMKVKDDPKRLAKALAKRRNKKRSSAKKWAGRLQKLQQSVDSVVEDRTLARQTARAQREKKTKDRQRKRESKGGASGGAGAKRGKKGGDRKGPAAKNKNNKGAKKSR